MSKKSFFLIALALGFTVSGGLAQAQSGEVPQITAATPTEIRANSAQIVLNVNGPFSEARIWYAASEPVLESDYQVTDPSPSTSIGLSNLTASTTYYFFVTVTNDEDLTATSSTHSFTTLSDGSDNGGNGDDDGDNNGDNEEPDDTTAPSILAMIPSELTENSVRLEVQTDEAPFSFTITYSLDENLMEDLLTTATSTASSTVLSDLASGTTYYYYALAWDEAGNESRSADQFFTTLGESGDGNDSDDGDDQEEPSDDRDDDNGDEGGGISGGRRIISSGSSRRAPAQVAGVFTGIPSGQNLGLPVAGGTVPELFTTNLGQGSSGELVLDLQRRLTELNYYQGPITGYFGPLTEAAVQRYQSANGLPSTGFVGPLTRGSLNQGSFAAGAGIGLPTAGGLASRQAELAALQYALLELELAARQLQLIQAGQN